MRLLRATAVALSAVMLFGLSTAASADVPPDPEMADKAFFNDPQGYQTASKDRLVSLFRNAPAGSTVRASIYTFDNTEFANEIVAAKNRGVSVQIVADGEVDTSPNPNPGYNVLASGLGTSPAASSWIKQCSPRSCIGNNINHNKFFLFSSSANGSNIVFQTSSNFKTGNFTAQYNNALQIVFNTTLYNAYLTYFNDLKSDVQNLSYYKTFSAGNAKAYFFPRGGSGASTDTIYNALNDNVACTGNTFGATVIRIAMFDWSRTEVAQEIRDLANQGCVVEVVYGKMASAVRSSLINHSRIKIYKLYSGASDGHCCYVHSKYMLIQGTYTGVKDIRVVFTGSPNFTYPGLRSNDEAIIKFNSTPIHDSYVTNFGLLKSRAVAG